MMMLLRQRSSAATVMALLVTIFGASNNLGVNADLKCNSIDSHELCNLAHGCKWLDGAVYCVGEHETAVPCTGVYDAHHCDEKAGCKWFGESGKCKPEDYHLQCFDILHDYDCNHRPDCEFDHPNTACHPKGKENMPCEQIKVDEMCTAKNTCIWLGETSSCHTKGELAPDACKELYVESACKTMGCEWEEQGTLSLCHQPRAPRACERFEDGTSCTSDTNCEWLDSASMCHRKGINVGCGRLFDEPTCKGHDHCSWNAHASKCHHGTQMLPCVLLHVPAGCTANGCVWDSVLDQCRDPGAKAACLRHGSKTTCSHRDHCKWYRGFCRHADMEELECRSLSLKKDCLEHRCMWDNEMCAEHEASMDEPKPDAENLPPLNVLDELMKDRHKPDCRAHVCDGEPTSCPEGEVLAMHSYECCKRCSLPSVVCESHHDYETCPHGRCEWHMLDSFCSALGEDIPCPHFHDSEKCQSKRCVWHDDIAYCSVKDAAVPCDRLFDESHCTHAHCFWSAEHHTCLEQDSPLPCDLHFQELGCNRRDECLWDVGAHTCKHKGAELHCNKYYSEEGCSTQKSRCRWSADTFLCTHIAGHVPCGALTHDECPRYADCRWNANFVVCEDDLHFEPLPCHDHFDDVSCSKETNCSWHTAGQFCRQVGEPISCANFYSGPACRTEEQCSWSDSGTFCYLKTDGPLCDLFYEAAACIGDSCTWDAKVHRCLKKGQKRQCEDFYSQTVCVEDGCIWDEHVSHCHGKDGKPECALFYDESHCTGRGDCEWNSAANLCHTSGEIPKCESFMHREACEDHECKFLPSQSMCINPDEDHCNHYYDQPTCKTHASGCGWDSRSGRCRKLRLRHTEL
eukprot:m.263155 g.263155  ORF g.263155 m.263155 type:complete len:855 (+) comp26704_c0_seq1:143-2707(+)